jgi:hypothetical protein
MTLGNAASTPAVSTSTCRRWIADSSWIGCTRLLVNSEHRQKARCYRALEKSTRACASFGGRQSSLAMRTFDAGRVVAIRDFRYIPYIVADAELRPA